MSEDRLIHKTANVGASEVMTDQVIKGLKFHEPQGLPWDHEVLAITETHMLLLNTEKKEYVSFQHDNKGVVYSGFYTKDKTRATDDFVKRMRIYL